MAYNNGRPCAACKHQRMKCSPQCIFAPYFPPEQKQNFLNVKEVYGVNNVKEILSALDPKDRAAAVTSLVYEAEIRLKEPVYGCVGYVAHLQQKLKSLNTELASAYEELASLSGPSTGTMPRQQPAAAYGQRVYDPLQQQRRMMGVQFSSPAAVPYGAATSASHQAQMMGFGNNPSSSTSGQQQQHGIGMDMRQYAALVATHQHQPQPGVQLSSSAAQMDSPAAHGRAGTQIMMGVGLGNPSSSTSGQQQQYEIDVDARQYAALVATHQHQPQPGVQLSSLAAQMGAPAVYGRSGKQIMMGVGNNPSSSTSGQQQQHGMDMRQYAAVVATDQHQPQPGVQLSSSAAQMDVPAVYGRSGKQIMMGVGLSNPSSSTTGQQQQYGINVDARQYAALVASHQQQPQPGVQLSSLAAQMGAPAVYGRSGKQIMMGVGDPYSSSISGQQQRYGIIGVDTQRYGAVVATHHQHQPGVQLASPSAAIPYGMTQQAQMMGTSDVYGGAGTSQQAEMMGVQGNDRSSGLIPFTNLAPSSQSQLIGEQYGSGYVVTTDQVQRHDELARNYSYQLHNQQQGGLASSSVLLPYTNRTGVTSDVYGGAGTSQQPQLTTEEQLYNQHEFGVDYTQQYEAVAATDQQYDQYISSDHNGGR